MPGSKANPGLKPENQSWRRLYLLLLKIGIREWPTVSIRHALGPGLLQGRRIPREFVKEAADAPLPGGIRRGAVIGEGVLHPRHREDRRDARHAEFAQGRAKLHRRPHAAEGAAGIADD